MCEDAHKSPEKGVRSGAGGIGSAAQRRCWELNLATVKVQEALLTTEISL